MASDPITVEADARRLLERAVQWDQAPVLTSAEVDDLLLMAVSQDEDTGTDQYTGRDLNGAAAAGWRMKAGKVAGSYTMSLGDGVKLERSDVYEHCLNMAAAYYSGRASVLGKGRGGIVSIPLVSDIGSMT